jgi:hypothetical protein
MRNGLRRHVLVVVAPGMQFARELQRRLMIGGAPCTNTLTQHDQGQPRLIAEPLTSRTSAIVRFSGLRRRVATSRCECPTENDLEFELEL